MHCNKYCKKIIIFYLTLSPLFCLSSLTLSPLSLISCPCLSIAKPSSRNPAPQSTAQEFAIHEFVIHNPRSTTRAMRVRAHHGANEVLGFIEAELWNLGFFVCGFCWLMRFWLIYEVLGVWFDGLLLDYFTTSSEMKAPTEVTDRRELKMRERREMGEKI